MNFRKHQRPAYEAEKESVSGVETTMIKGTFIQTKYQAVCADYGGEMSIPRFIDKYVHEIHTMSFVKKKCKEISS